LRIGDVSLPARDRIGRDGPGPEIARKHYGKWSITRQSRIDDLMTRVYIAAEPAMPETARV
jgi:hypothetical protein